jgi:hypothetical protein
MVLLAGLVGIVAGLGAVAFQYLSRLVLKYGLEFIAGYKPAGPAARRRGVRAGRESPRITPERPR